MDRPETLDTCDAMNFGSSGEDVVKYEIESADGFPMLVLNAFPITLESPWTSIDILSENVVIFTPVNCEK